jgi:hypothetical protein
MLRALVHISTQAKKNMALKILPLIHKRNKYTCVLPVKTEY